jgi:predicted nucleic acid-binding Zn ribbon protein
MLDHRTPLWRWLTRHRYQLAAATGLALVAAVLLGSAPLLLALAAVEWRQRHRRLLGLAVLGLLARAVVWLWQELRGLPHGRWHSCVQCGTPIEEPSRAEYCSPACRRVAQLERERGSSDAWIAERAEARLHALARTATDPALAEIPF